jgi:uracil-DNA glycosylase family 4
MPTVPNRPPKFPDGTDGRLAIIGEAPGPDEVLCGEPFVGSSGKLLRLIVEQSGAIYDSCFVGNICQHRPPDNEIENFSWEGPEIQAGLFRLRQDLEAFKPTCILSLGRTAFRFFNPSKCYVNEKKKLIIPLQDWRGSIFISPVGYKTVATFHPAYIQRVFTDIPYFRFDVGRAIRHSRFVGLANTVRTGTLRPTVSDVVSFLQNLRANKTPAAIDIEGYTDALGVTMFGIAPSRASGLVIPFYIDGKSYWSEEDEIIVWRELSAYLADPNCPKCCHSVFYETVVMGWRHRCIIAGRVGDTMMLQWEWAPEIEKSLGVTVSFWTEEQYYKDERETSDSNIKLGYNFKDCTCTKECEEEIPKHLNNDQLCHYSFNVSLVPAFTYMQLRGCRLDVARVRAHCTAAETELATLTEKLDASCSVYLGHSFNAKSTDDKAWFLYDFLGYEPYKRFGRTTKEEILHRYYVKHQNPLVKTLIQAVSKRTRISDLGRLLPNSDGRIRSAYGLVDTVTGRINSRESSIVELLHDEKGRPYWDHVGTNLQNITKAIRDCFISDGDDFDFFEADLEGADAWTVAADLAALGAPAMLEDLIAHIKPSKVLLVMLDEIEAGHDPARVARMSASEIKPIVDNVIIPDGILPDGRPASWKYISMKRVQHGTNYDGKEDTISATIFKDSDGVIDVPPSKIAVYQTLYRLRYNTTIRNEWIRRELGKTGILKTATGFQRKFFGIRNPRAIDDEIIRQASATEPQQITTNRINMCIRRLWFDSKNRRRSGALFVEPLLQIHDALAGQFPSRLRDQAAAWLVEWFDNPINIHGIPITIPFEGKFGHSWGECKNKLT